MVYDKLPSAMRSPLLRKMRLDMIQDTTEPPKKQKIAQPMPKKQIEHDEAKRVSMQKIHDDFRKPDEIPSLSGPKINPDKIPSLSGPTPNPHKIPSLSGPKSNPDNRTTEEEYAEMATVIETLGVKDREKIVKIKAFLRTMIEEHGIRGRVMGAGTEEIPNGMSRVAYWMKYVDKKLTLVLVPNMVIDFQEFFNREKEPLKSGWIIAI
jgi:hypothetical protein